MRLPGLMFLRGLFLSLAVASSVFGQSYTISTFAGGALPVNIPGTSASIGQPQSVASDPSGNVFFADQNTVLRLDAITGTLTLVAGNGTPGFSGDNGPATSAQLNQPHGVALDSAGNLYIADTANARVRKVSDGVITTVAGGGTSGLGDGGPATSASLNGPGGVAVDSAGNLYITDGDRIRKVSGGVITTVAGIGPPYPGGPSFGGDGGPATSAQLYSP
jgi:trimeric autotransporter adhesin